MLGELVVGLAGTPKGAQIAVVLALNSALFHAIFGALQKGRFDPWVSRGAIDFWLIIIAAPVALFLVPWPDGPTFLILIGAFFIHFIYKLTIAFSYERAAYTVVYPVIRGTGPLLTAVGAGILFAESYSVWQWVGLFCLSSGILLLSLRNISETKIDVRALKIGLLWAFAGGVMVAVYTVYDAWGIRQSANPFTFLAWFFLISSLDFPIIAAFRLRKLNNPPPLKPLLTLGFIGAWIAIISFGGVMLATRLDSVGEAAALRETSVLFAAAIGFLFLGEHVGPRKAALMAMIGIGAILVEVGG